MDLTEHELLASFRVGLSHGLLAVESPELPGRHENAAWAQPYEVEPSSLWLEGVQAGSGFLDVAVYVGPTDSAPPQGSGQLELVTVQHLDLPNGSVVVRDVPNDLIRVAFTMPRGWRGEQEVRVFMDTPIEANRIVIHFAGP